jgi:hypothetical protein
VTIGLSPIPSLAEAFALIDADGGEHPLSQATGYMVLQGIRGRFWPAVSWVENRAPNIPGTVLQNVSVAPLDWDLPLLVTGETPAQLHQRVRDLVYWLDPRRGDVVFVNTAADGETRRLTCRCEGIDFVEDNPPHRRCLISFHAADPYWYAEDAEETTFSESFSTPVPFLNPSGFFPLNLSSSVLYSSPTIDNPGDTDSWPTWRIVGPGTNPSLRNLDTGEVMTFTRTLAAGDTILVELSRDAVIVTDALGTRLYSVMSNASVPWPIRPGINRAQIGMDGATSASSITISYVPRFLGP